MPFRFTLFIFCVVSITPASAPSPPRHFEAQTGVDSLIDSSPIPLPPVKPAESWTNESGASANDTAAAPAAVNFSIQLDALSDMDAAQARKTALEQALGEKIAITFDPPYYKLRLGNFATRREAENALVDLAERGVRGFVVRQ
jgi:septal ring-binding cell division protein DamX